MDYEGQPVIVLGMGRSGTSIIASLLEKSGVRMYNRAVPAGEINPRGYFEDADFVAFHQELKQRTAANTESSFNSDTPLVDEISPLELTDEIVSRGEALLQQSQSAGLWGWKDPRTVLFTDLWLHLLPNAKILIPIRHPMGVFSSYLKRVPDPRFLRSPEQVFISYGVYHSRILQIVRDRPDHCLVIAIREAMQDPDRLVRVLGDFLGPDFHGDTDFSWYKPEEFDQAPASEGLHRLFGRLYPAAAERFDTLNSLAAIPWLPEPREAGIEWIEDAVTRSNSSGADWLPLLFNVAQHLESGSYSQRYAHLFDRYAAEYDKARRYIAELESANAFFGDQLATHRTNLDEQRAYVSRMEGRIQELVGEVQELLKPPPPPPPPPPPTAKELFLRLLSTLVYGPGGRATVKPESK